MGIQEFGQGIIKRFFKVYAFLATGAMRLVAYLMVGIISLIFLRNPRSVIEQIKRGQKKAIEEGANIPIIFK